MNSFLRQSTNSQDRSIGPFVSDSDFFTPQTGLTIANTDIKLVKNGAASVNKNSGGGTHRVNGVYGVTFNSSDTDTVGELQVSIFVSGACIAFHTFTVLEEAVYDAFYAASAPGYVVDQPVNVTKIGGDAQSATDLKDFADAGYDPSTNKVTGVVLVDTVTTYTGNTPQTGDSFARLGAPAGASVSADIAAVKAQTAAIETDTQDIQNRLPAALSSGRMVSVAQVVSDKTDYVLADASISAAKFAAGAIDAAALAQSAGQEIADEVLNRNLAGGGSGNSRNVRNALRSLRNRVNTQTGDLVVYEEDDTTTAWSGPLTRDAVDPIVEVNPS